VRASASGWLSPAFFLFLLLLLPLPPPWACAPVLGLLYPFSTWAAGECQARPSVALTHLSARLNSVETYWISWVVSFSSIFSSLTHWRSATTTEALEIRGMILQTWENRWTKERRDPPERCWMAWRSVSLSIRAYALSKLAVNWRHSSGQESRVPSGRFLSEDGCAVDLQELSGIDHPVVLLGQVGPELVRPDHHTQV
jgi:uncharacterized protein (DUF2384 family)